MTSTGEGDLLVPGAHRRIRTLADGEGPWHGVLVAAGERVLLWRDAGEGAAGIDWRFVGAEHVAAPLDVARTVDGHGALMPWCTMRLAVFLTRRITAGAPLEAGEWSTLVASLLRGLREIVERSDADLGGEWWITREGRPLCVPAPGRPAGEAAVDVLALAEEGCRERGLRRLVASIRDALSEGAPTAVRVASWEQELFAFAAPRPLRLDAHAPERVRGSVAEEIRPVGLDLPPRRVRSRTGFGQHVAAGIEAMRARAGDLRARIPRVRTGSGRRPRRAALLVAAGAVAAVLGVGLWPAEGESVSEAAVPEASPAAPEGSAPPDDGIEQPETAPPSSDAESDPESDPGDPVVAAGDLLAALDACVDAGDETCPAAIAPASSADAAKILRSDAAGEPVLVDDYGDLAVIRLGGAESAEQMLVLVRQDGRWLVRDAYDVADQPEDG